MSGVQPTAVSLYAPVTGGGFVAGASAMVTHSARESTFVRAYTLLKAQRTVLSRTQYSIQNRAEEGIVTTSEGEEACQLLLIVLDSILSSTIFGLFGQIDSSIVQLRTLLGNKDLEEKVHKWGVRVLVSLIALRKLAESLVFSVIFGKNKEDQNPRLNPEQKPSHGSVETVICRICEESIPIQRFERHVESCIEVYRNESKLAALDTSLGDVVKRFGKTFLNEEWPGLRSQAIDSTIPFLQIWLMFSVSLGIDARTSDGADELGRISLVLQEYILQEKYRSNEMILAGTKLVIEKSRRATVLTTASAVLQETRLSGSSGTKKESTRISDFQFVKMFSSGAFARVFLARKKNTGDLFAIKVLPKSDITQKNQMKRILTERDILLQLNNPYIVNFYYSIIGRNNLYLVMEYLPGGDLYSLLQNLAGLDDDTAKVYTYQIVQALGFLRSHGIIHHDLKPDNILISGQGTLKLTDFGLSHLGFVDRQTTSEIAKSSSLVGTPDYVAPEVILSQPHSFTADYWSLGVIIYELFAGVPPFHAETEQETYANILAGTVDYSELEEDCDISPEALDLIRRLLVLDPDERIGAKDISEIVNHPWFKDLDHTAPPPFVPQVTCDEMTDYFESRYATVGDHTDILQDMAEENHDHVDGDDMQMFRATSIEQLAKQNLRVAQRLREGERPETPPMEMTVAGLLGDQPPNPNANAHRQLTLTQVVPPPHK